MLSSKKGFTLLEVVISAVLLALLTAGMSPLFFGVKRWIFHARTRMQGSEVSRRYLDVLQRDVRDDQWNPPTNCLSTDGAAGCPGADTLDGIPYNPNFNIGAPPFGGNSKKVRLTVTWNEPVM